MLTVKTPRERWLGIGAAYWTIVFAVVIASVAVRHADPGFFARLRLLGFDMLQQTWPRTPDANYPVRIIDIDERSLSEFGNWPWRRDLLATLVDRLAAAGARVIVFDVVFPDATTSTNTVQSVENSGTPSNKVARFAEKAINPLDAAFADAIDRNTVVLGMIGTARPSTTVPNAKASFATIGKDVESFAPGLRGASGNLAVFEEKASGVGTLNWFPDHDQILRRIPLVVRIGDQLYPSLAAETIRVGNTAKTIRVRSAGDGGFSGDIGITAIDLGKRPVATDADGQIWLWFTRHDPKRSLSAADVLNGTLAPGVLDGRVAIIGTSAPGLFDLRATPLDPVISGVEINAQAIEQLLSGRPLYRPDFAKGLEIAMTILSALILAGLVFFYGAGVAAIVGFGAVGVFALGSLAAFSQGILLDAVFPILANSATYIAGTGYLYYEAESERNRNREALERIAREMEAAAQIQRTFLPKDLPGGPMSDAFDIFAVMKPAKSVGGDFYDYFLTHGGKLGFAVGDVSGKGVPAALFMSVSRTVLRTVAFEDHAPGEVLTRVNAILARDNTEGMFVTIFYAVLDLKTGELEFSSAGHDDALLLSGSGSHEALGYMGPAIGLFDFSTYPTGTRHLAPADTMLLLTDGITEAFNIDGRVFGAERLAKSARRRTYETATGLVEAITAEVTRFSEGTEQSDDITVVAMRYRGRAATAHT